MQKGTCIGKGILLVTNGPILQIGPFETGKLLDACAPKFFHSLQWINLFASMHYHLKMVYIH